MELGLMRFLMSAHPTMIVKCQFENEGCRYFSILMKDAKISITLTAINLIIKSE
jgi:hypothetical protein